MVPHRLNLVSEEVRVSICSQAFKGLHFEPCSFMALHTGDLGLLQCLTKLVSVPEDHFGEYEAKQKLERLHLALHSLNTSFHPGVGGGSHSSFP